MKKNPFSLFDFLGYVFPGALSIYLFYFCYSLGDINNFDNIIACAKSMKIPSIEDTIFLTLASYVIGHFVAYLSSLTIEQYSIWLYGYPSDFLLKDVESGRYWNILKHSAKTCSISGNITIMDDSVETRNITGNITIMDDSVKIIIRKYLARIIMILVVLPISICTVIFSKFFGLKYFFIKKLDRNMISTIHKKCKLLAEYLNYEFDHNETDLHRVIHHYEYEVMKMHSIKMDNYVALYGFLRAISFIFNVVFLYILFKSLQTVAISNDINWFIVLIICLLGVVTYVFFMGFMKFYRRYTLESFMCLIIDKSYIKENPTFLFKKESILSVQVNDNLN